MALMLGLLASPAIAADLGEAFPGEPNLPPLPRYFPRGDGMEAQAPLPLPHRRARIVCTPRRVPVPTNAPDDPSYVGSPYGLGKPSYYGFTPPPGIDDPYGRSVLPYCP